MAFSESQLQEEVEEVGVCGRDITGTSAARTWGHHGKRLLSCHQVKQRVNAKLGPSAALQVLLPVLFHPPSTHLGKERW